MKRYIGLFIGWACFASVTTYFNKPTTPENFDSMVCRVNTPMGSLLITHELMTCTNGKKYRLAE